MKKPHLLKRLQEDRTKVSYQETNKTPHGPWQFASQQVSCDCELAGAAGEAGQDGRSWRRVTRERKLVNPRRRSWRVPHLCHSSQANFA